MAATGSRYLGVHNKAEAMGLFAQHVSSGKVAFFKSVGIDFVLGRREGLYLWDIAGKKRLIDCHCNGGVFNLGHRHSAIVQVLMHSLQELDIGNHHLISEQRAALAGRLAQLTPGDLTYTVFGVGGGEAVDLAIKVARGYTGRAKIVSARGGYHGHTGFALAAGDEKYRAPFGPMAPGFFQVPFGDVEALERAVDEETAAVLLETVPATYGMLIPDEAFFFHVRELCDKRGALLIVDEVQTGLGRTGRLWGIEHFDVVPDVMVIGKGLSGGVYAEVGCPVALKVLEISSDPAFLHHVEEMAGVFAAGFQRLKEEHPQVLVGLRQLGLMMGIEMANAYCGPLFSQAAYEAGLLSVYANNDPRVAQLLPPLMVDRPLADEILERVDKALGVVEGILEG
jgi:acetylornithine/succinyldiaminopimelate/putrescine aminotransferase